MAHPVAKHRVYDLLDVIEREAVSKLQDELACDEAMARSWISKAPVITALWTEYNEKHIQHILAYNMKGLTAQDLGR